MKIFGFTFSPGNMKIGKIWNFSLPPIISCPVGVPCANTRTCYALKAYRLYKGAKAAWDENWNLLQTPVGYVILRAAVDKLLINRQPEYFRIHVSGDFINQNYLNLWKKIALDHPETQFLAFTKRYDFDYSDCPANLRIIFSMWPGGETPMDYTRRCAWLYDEDYMDTRIPPAKHWYLCPGSCVRCKHCWESLDDVVFIKH